MGCDIHGGFFIKPNLRSRPQHEWHWLPVSWPSGRNYSLFAALAGVRNYHESACIAEPRGLPEGFSQEQKVEPYWWCGHAYPRHGSDGLYVEFGDHSFSWLTLDEMLAFDWSQPVHMSGLVAEAGSVFSRGEVTYDADGEPSEYCMGTNAPAKEVKWTQPISKRCKDFLLTIRYLKERFPKEEIMFVFGFDS